MTAVSEVNAALASTRESAAGDQPDWLPQYERLVLQRAGIVLHPHQRESLVAAILDMVSAKYPDPCVLVEALSRSAETTRSEWDALVHAVTVPESYFFRDEEQFACLRKEWLPALLERKRQLGDRSLRVWSAGCSHGQEIYSISMLLHELIPEGESWHLDLVGTDINETSISIARRGLYRDWSMRLTPNAVRDRCFERVGDAYRVSARFRQPVRFMNRNLAEDKFPSVADGLFNVDLILCRNVFIYMNEQGVRRILNAFRETLSRDGMLLLGPSDHFIQSDEGLVMETRGNAFRYLRNDVSDAMAVPNSPPNSPKSPASTPAPARLPVKPPAARKQVGKPKPTKKRSPLPAKPVINLDGILELSSAGRWQEVLAATGNQADEHSNNVQMLFLRAMAQANLGQLDEAGDLCQQGLESHPGDERLHYLQALVLLELGHEQAAQAALRKAIYLAQDFIEAYHRLGLLLRRRGDVELARRYLKNGLREAERHEADEPLRAMPDMTCGQMATVLRQSLGAADATGTGTTQSLL